MEPWERETLVLWCAEAAQRGDHALSRMRRLPRWQLRRRWRLWVEARGHFYEAELHAEMLS